jgi:periplasmic protein CpxP/Spy
MMGEPAHLPPPPPSDSYPMSSQRGMPPGMWEATGQRDPLPPHLRGLDLTADQRDRLIRVFKSGSNILRDKMREVERFQGALNALALSEDFDDAMAESLAIRAAKAVAEATLIRACMEQEVFRLLTQEQRQQLKNGASGCPPAPIGGNPRDIRLERR